MKIKTLVPTILLIVAILLGGVYYINKKGLFAKDESSNRAKVVTPVASDSDAGKTEARGTEIEGESYETFVPLNPGETLISTLLVDINNDGYDDEVIAVRSTTNPTLYLVPAIIDPVSGNYTRLEPIQTKFTSTRTFSYSSMDVIGEHKNSLIYQGVDDSGNYIMEIFLYQENKEKADSRGRSKNSNKSQPENTQSLEKPMGQLISIGSFSCDGTIFIQQVERSESYELSLSKGESFSVWVYKSEKTIDPKTKKEVENQIQQEFKWNPISQHYELAQEINVTAGRLAAKEHSRIQDGTVETFASFLDGLWYKTSNVDGNIRYIYFDYDAGEIILLKADTEEVYLWEDSKLRHNGMYVTAVNADIMNLRRRFDVGLVNVDEIRITVQDYINLLIKENNMWDGNYKKMTLQSSIFHDKKEVSPVAEFYDNLREAPAWISADNATRISFTDYNYALEENDKIESGIYTMMPVGEYKVIQFRSDSLSSMLSDAYTMKFGTKTITETVKRKTVEKTVTDYDTIIFSPVKISSNDTFPVEGRSFTFLREELPPEVEEE